MGNAPRIVIAGGTGFLGRSLAKHLLDRGNVVVILGRHARQVDQRSTFAVWDGRTVEDWVTHLNGAHALVNLVGRSVDCRKTPDHCDEILRSRVDATEALGRALGQVERRPAVCVQMSTAHRYGDPPTVWCNEDSAFGHGLAPFVAEAGENAHARHAPADMGHVVLRTSFVLGRAGGAMRRLLALTRNGLGGKVGSGRQGISWIHETDMNRLFATAIFDSRMRGAYVATAPHPVSNAEFMRELRRALGMPLGLPSAEWMVRLAAPMMRTDPELALYGRYCTSRRLAEEGFTFRYPDVRSAIQDLFGRSRTQQEAAVDHTTVSGP